MTAGEDAVFTIVQTDVAVVLNVVTSQADHRGHTPRTVGPYEVACSCGTRVRGRLEAPRLNTPGVVVAARRLLRRCDHCGEHIDRDRKGAPWWHAATGDAACTGPDVAGHVAAPRRRLAPPQPSSAPEAAPAPPPPAPEPPAPPQPAPPPATPPPATPAAGIRAPGQRVIHEVWVGGVIVLRTTDPAKARDHARRRGGTVEEVRGT